MAGESREPIAMGGAPPKNPLAHTSRCRYPQAMRHLLLTLLLALPAAASAQVISVYATFSGTDATGLVNGNAGNVTSGYFPTTTSHFSPGVGAGVTFGVLPIGPVHIGLDLRGSTKPGSDGADLILAGPRLGLKLPAIRLKPYVQASGGYLRTRTTLVNSGLPSGTQLTAQYGAWEALGGVDYPLLPVLDFRVIEVGAGRAYEYSAAGVSGSYTVSLFTINSGLVLHF